MLILSVNVVIINSKHVWTLESNFFQTEILELNFHVAIHVGSISLKKKKKNLMACLDGGGGRVKESKVVLVKNKLILC